MRAISARIEARPQAMLPVWFNAWRYEREEHLVVPLPDNLREALDEYSTRLKEGSGRSRVREAAARFGRAARVLLRGITVTGGVPGLEASLAFD